ncbi:MAG TPA: hypothetical protein VGF65_13445, partial [Mycobacterium sp.]
MYAEQEPSDARTAAALMPTPGLIPSGFVLGTGPIYAMNSDYQSIVYAVSGTSAYRLSQVVFPGPATLTYLGEVGTPSGVNEVERNLMVTIAVGVNAVVFCVPPNAFTCGHNDTAINQIGGSFPGARSVTYLDGYFVFTSVSVSAQFFTSLLLDPSSFDALDFAFADGVPNILRRVVTLRGELWLIGEAGLEIWYDAGSSGLETTPGTSFFPFRRQSGGVLPHGTVSIKSVAIVDGSVFWVSMESMVMRSVGYKGQ